MSHLRVDAAGLPGLVESITRELAHSLKEAPENIGPDQSFAAMGADSLILLEALQEINARYRVSLTVQEIYERVDTVAKVARYILENQPAAGAPELPAAVAPLAPEAIEAPGRAPAEPGDRQQVIEEIVRQQLDLMERQLALLGRRQATPAASRSLAASRPFAAEAPAAPAAPPAAPEASAPRPAPGGAAPDRFSAFGAVLGSDERAQDAAKVEAIGRLAARLNEKTPRSKAEVQARRRVLADNRVPAGFRPLLKEMVYPILAEEASGAHVVDIDGNRYVDFTMGFGAHLFGHSPPFVVEAIQRQIERGMPIGPQSPIAGRVAELIAELTGHARVTFCNSGTEATMTAVRLARARTGRSLIVVFRNSYHGTFDGFLARTSASGESRPASLGTPASAIQDTVVLDYCDDASIDYIERHHASIAAVLVEPVQSRAPSLEPGPFLRRLRAATHRRGVALLFDEVITGFRCAPGGAQELFDVRADLCTYGKVVGGGMPIGVIAGSPEYMDGVDGGFWQFGDASYPAQPTIFFAGTFSKHPLTMAASLAVLEHIQAHGAALYEPLHRRTQELCRRLNAAFEAEGVEIRAESFSSLFRFASKVSLDVFYYKVLDAGYFIWEGRNCFVSTAHTDDDLAGFASAVQRICRELVAAKLLPARPAGAAAAVGTALAAGGRAPLADAQQRFYQLARAQPDGNIACNLCFGLVFDAGVDQERLADAVLAVAAGQDALWYRIDLERATQEAAPEADRRLSIERVPIDRRAGEPGLVDALLRDQQMEALDPAAGRNLRARLVTFADGAALLGLSVHHLVCDGWGLAVLFERIAAAYSAAARPASASPAARPALSPDVSYTRWLAHEAIYRQGERASRDRTFWHGVIEAIAAYQRSHAPGAVQHRAAIGARRGGRARLTMDERVTSLFREQARADRVTPFTALLAGFQVFLNRVYRSRLPILGIPFANRTSGELKQIVGSCVNLLPLLPVHGRDVTFEHSLAHTKQAMNEMFQHASFPYHEMCELYQRVTGQERVAPVEATFNVEPLVEVPSFDAARPTLVAALNGVVEFDLMCNLFVLPDEMRIELDYDADLLAEDIAYGWLNLFSKIIENYAGQADPARRARPAVAAGLA